MLSDLGGADNVGCDRFSTGKNEPPAALDGIRTAFASANTNAVVHGEYKYLPVTNLALLARFGCSQDGRDGWLYELIIDRDLQLHFAKQREPCIFTAGRDLALLPTKALAIDDSQAKHLDLG